MPRRRGVDARFNTLITFVLGLAVGYTLCYAWLRTSEPTTKEASAPVPAAVPADAPTGPASASTEPTVLAGFEPARHLFIAVPGDALNPAYTSFLAQVRPAGVVLREENVTSPDQTARLAEQIREAVASTSSAGAPPLVAVDPARVADALGLKGAPSPALLGGRRDAAAAREAGRALAKVCKAHGVSVVLGPNLSFASSPATGAAVPARDAFAADAATVIAVGLAYVDGIMQGGVIPVATGYPGPSTEEREGYPVLAQDVAEIAQTLLPFTEAVSKGLLGVMAGPVAVPALDTRYPQRPAALSPVMVGGVLRGEGRDFDGVVLASDVAAPPLAGRYAPEDAVVEALAAGCDAVLFTEADPERIRSVCAAVTRAVQRGVLTRARLDESRARLERWQVWLKDPQPLKGPIPDLAPLRPAASEPATTPSPATQEAPVQEARATAPEPAPEMEAPAPATPVEPAPVETASTAPEETAAPPSPVAPEPEPETPVAPAEPVPAAAPAEETPAPSEPAPQQQEPDDRIKVRYTVKKGDMLSRLAKEFEVSQKEILDLNDLDDPNLRWGTELDIYITRETAARLGYGPDGSPPAEPSPEPEPEPEPETTPQPSAEPGWHVVQTGDNATQIARRYGISVQQLLEWNGISDPDRILLGQRLRVRADAGRDGSPG